MLYAYDILTHLRGRLRDIPFRLPLTTALSAADDTTTITVGTTNVNYFKIGGVVELVPTSGGLAISASTPEEAKIMEVNATSGTILVKRGYNFTTPCSASSGASAGFWITSFDFFTNHFLVNTYNEVVKKIFPNVYRKAIKVYEAATDTLTEYDSGVWWTFTFPTEAIIYEVNGVGITDAGDLVPVTKWEVKENRSNLLAASIFPFENAQYDGHIYGGVDGGVGDKTIVMPGMSITDYPSYHAGLLAPYPLMVYGNYLYNPITDALAATYPLLPTSLLRLVSLGVELICMESMLVDREKYDRYTTAAWNQAVTPYEISNAITNLQAMFRLELDERTMVIPRVRRRMNS